MKKKLLIIMTLLLAITITGCTKTTKGEEEPTIKFTLEDTEAMEKVSKYIVFGEKESLKVEELTEEEKETIARAIIEKATLETTGTEMRTNFQKYFGKDQTVIFHNIPCFEQHQTEEEQILFVFNQETDKYEYSPNHPGHGGGGNAKIKYLVANDGITIDGNTINYDAKVLFYGPSFCYDVGGCKQGKLYKTYSDAKNETNSILDIDNSEYTSDGEYGIPQADLDAVLEDYKKEGSTYRFTFIKENDNVIFKEYKKQ